MSLLEKKCIIIGVDHRIQYRTNFCGPEWTTDLNDFKNHLINLSKKLNADLIAEEFSEECLVKSSGTSSIARDVADIININHLFCDPNSKERVLLNILTYEQRECEWLRRIRYVNPSSFIFVCGNSHKESFSERLSFEGYKVQIDTKHWGNDWMYRN